MSSIYGLRINGQQNFFYVGHTTKPLQTRLRFHLYDAKKNFCANKEKTRVIIESNYEVEIVPIETGFASHDEGLIKEMEWINRLAEWGHPLVNIRRKPSKWLLRRYNKSLLKQSV